MTRTDTLQYVIAVQAPAYRVNEDEFATESAFALHLQELRAALGERFSSLILVAPQLSKGEYLANKDHLGRLSAERDGIWYVPAHSLDGSTASFWFSDLPRVFRSLSPLLRRPTVVHSGMSDDIRRPLMAAINLLARFRRQPVLFIVDIDFRADARRYYQLGLWSPKRYFAHRFVFDPVKWIQVWLAPRMFQLVLLKSASMVRDFGRGRQHVKNFYDTVHSSKDVLPESEHAAHIARLSASEGPLNAVYFGRFVAYKGLSYAIEAVRLAREAGADIRLTLIGDGDCREQLVRQVAEARLNGAITFKPPVRYGPALFELLSDAHVTLATPLVEDTPRATFDSMARGLPVVAFDINYFRDLARESGAIALVKWPDAKVLADELVSLSRDRLRLGRMAKHALAFAVSNTQSIWVSRRVGWLEQLLFETPPEQELRSIR